MEEELKKVKKMSLGRHVDQFFSNSIGIGLHQMVS